MGRRKDFDLGALTRKDFVAVADILCRHNASPAMVDDFVDFAREQNPRFNESRFRSAIKKCKRR